MGIVAAVAALLCSLGFFIVPSIDVESIAVRAPWLIEIGKISAPPPLVNIRIINVAKNVEGVSLLSGVSEEFQFVDPRSCCVISSWLKDISFYSTGGVAAIIVIGESVWQKSAERSYRDPIYIPLNVICGSLPEVPQFHNYKIAINKTVGDNVRYFIMNIIDVWHLKIEPINSNVGTQLPLRAASGNLYLDSADNEQKSSEDGDRVSDSSPPETGDVVVDGEGVGIGLCLATGGACLIWAAWKLADRRSRWAAIAFCFGVIGLWVGIVGLCAST